MKAGDVVADRFEIAKLAGSGAMGSVYQAYDRRLSQLVALKLMSADAPSDRFEREAQVLAGLDHHGIVRYVAHGFSNGDLYLAMDWLEGEDLESRLARGPLDPDEAMLVALQAAEALGAAHEQGVVHRDVKPSNLVLSNGSSSEVRLVDFGLAAVRYSAKKGPLTQVGLILGTPAYMAPEQVRCERRIDASADVFSLGCVLFECLTGRCPFEGHTPLATFAKVLLEEAPRVSSLVRETPEALDELVWRMLQKSREERPRDGAAVASMIARARADTAVASARSGSPSLTRHEQRLVCVVFLGQVLGGPDDASPVSGSRIAEHAPQSDVLARAPTMLDMPSVISDGPLSESAIFSRNGETPRLEGVRVIASRFDGEVEPLPDGSVVIVHGTRPGAADPTSRAAWSALALRAAFPRTPISLATGRSTTHESRTIGEALDRASELIEHAPRERGICIDDVSQGLLEARFELEAGLHGAVLVGERRAAKAERTLLGKKTVCVGRERELTTLLELSRATITRREPLAALVSAAAGVGKSRLRYEFLRRSAVESPEATIWVGWADPMGAGSPFGLLGPLIRRALGIDDGDEKAERQRKVSAGVARSVAPSEAARVAEFIGELVGAQFPDEERLHLRAARRDAVLLGDQMLRAWGDFVAAEAARAPIVLILEDIHWGDVPSLRFIDAAMGRAFGLSLFVLALGRPEWRARFPSLWAGRSVTEIPLSDLDVTSSRAIVKAALGSVDDALVREITERAAGNAFYLEELVQAVADGRGISLPGTVLAVAQARLEGLDDAERQVLRAASVFGTSFSQSGIAELLGEGACQGIDRRLAALTEREVLVVVEARGDLEPRFSFRHAILRDAAYAMLTPDDCALGHRLAGNWLERRNEGDPIILAEHFERGGAPERACGWYRRAAEQALEGNDFGGVKARVERSIHCGVSGHDGGRVHLLAAEAHRWCNENAESAKHACAAMALLERGSPMWFDAAGEAGLALGRLGRFGELGDVARDLCEAPGRAATPAVVAAMARVSDQLLFSGEHVLYRQIVDQVDAFAAAAVGDPVVHTWIIYVKAGEAMMRDAGEYVVQMRALVAGFEDLGDARNACLQRVNLADAYIHVGHYVEAVSLARATMAEGNLLGLRLTVVNAKCNLARALGELGELAEARAVSSECIAELRLAQDHRMEAALIGMLSRVLLESGELGAAEGAVRGALALTEAPLPVRCLNLARLAEVLRAQNRVAEASAAAIEASELLRSLGTLDDGEAYVRLAVAEVLLADPDVDPEVGRACLRDARARLLAKAETMSSAHFRALFLSNVAENAKTLALAETWCS